MAGAGGNSAGRFAIDSISFGMVAWRFVSMQGARLHGDAPAQRLLGQQHCEPRCLAHLLREACRDEYLSIGLMTWALLDCPGVAASLRLRPQGKPQGTRPWQRRAFSACLHLSSRSLHGRVVVWEMLRGARCWTRGDGGGTKSTPPCQGIG